MIPARGWESNEGPKNIERMPPGIYTVSGGKSQWEGRLMDRMRLRSNGRDLSAELSGFGVMTCANQERHPGVAGCLKPSLSTKILFHKQSGGWLLSGHSMDKVKKTAYRSQLRAKKSRVDLLGGMPTAFQPPTFLQDLVVAGGKDVDQLQNNGDLVNTVQSNREIRPRGENREIGAKHGKSLGGTVSRYMAFLVALVADSTLRYTHRLKTIRIGKAVLRKMVWSPAPETGDGG